MAREIINHRGEEFKQLLWQTETRLQKIFQTKNDILVLTSSGTGAMEAVIANLFSRNDGVLIASIGEFGDRFIKIADNFGLRVVKLKFPPGEAVEVKKLKECLAKNQNIKAVVVTHNETSTGVTNDLEAIARIVKRRGHLLVVDAISSLGAIDLPVDKWKIDVAIAASQKAFMAPPGLAMISMSKKAWVFSKRATLPKFYWNLEFMKESLDKGRTPFTPAVLNFFALNESLGLIFKEGLKKVFLRHRALGNYVRGRISKMGLTILPADADFASDTVTVVRAPAEVGASDLLRQLENKYGIVLAEGQGKLKGKIFRMAHLGFAGFKDMKFVCDALEETLKQLRR